MQAQGVAQLKRRAQRLPESGVLREIQAIVATEFPLEQMAVNCRSHAGRSLLERPPDCALCHVDISNRLAYVLRVNAYYQEKISQIRDALGLME